MTVTINGKDYELYLGLDFINYLDKKYYIEQNGFKLGQGLTYTIAQIELGNPSILMDLIVAATLTGSKPKSDEVKKFIETEADIEELMTDFLLTLEKSPTTRFTMKKLGLLMKEADKK
ncbi:MAG: tail assembly chaperone [Defluviitaleaceae bacterium]|nr:tail assembly chaperone [Defluviitaleaceae bacterium]